MNKEDKIKMLQDEILFHQKMKEHYTRMFEPSSVKNEEMAIRRKRKHIYNLTRLKNDN